MSEIDTACHQTAGTLLWIGDRHSLEFQEPFLFCESSVAQLALRCDVADALERRASAVQRILITHRSRQPIDVAAVNEMMRRYSGATMMRLLGTLCEGDRAGDPVGSSLPHCYWHRWNQILPQWLQPCLDNDGPLGCETSSRSAHSVAVIASSAVAAEPLLDLASSAGAAVVWCRRPDSFRTRNFDAVWWDDSAAGPASSQRWRERIGGINTATHQRHAWIVNSPRIEQYRQATEGGVDLVLSKPGQIECLLEMLTPAIPAPQTSASVSRLAA